MIVDDWLRQTYPERAAELESKLQITAQMRSHWQEIISQNLDSQRPKNRINRAM